jgi:hypothetical protein
MGSILVEIRTRPLGEYQIESDVIIRFPDSEFSLVFITYTPSISSQSKGIRYFLLVDHGGISNAAPKGRI